MLHSPELMIALNPLVQHYTRISPTDASQAAKLVDLSRLATEFNVTLSHPNANCNSMADSKTGEFVHYEIIDKFNMLFGSISKLLTYRACFRPLYAAGMSSSTKGSLSTSKSTSATTALPLHSQTAQDNHQASTSIGVETIADPGNGVSLLGHWTLSVDPTDPNSIILTESVKVHCNMLFSWFIRGQLETAHAALHKEFGVRFVRAMIEGDPMRGRDFRGGMSWGEVKRGTSFRGGVDVGGEKERELNEEWRRKLRGDGEREDGVSSMGDDVSVGVGESGASGLQRTRTNESGVSSMR